MEIFVKRLVKLRKEKKLSQTELSKQLSTSVSVISRYERDEMIPSIDTAKRLANILETTVGYLLSENEEADLFKDPEMLARFKAILSFSEDKQKHIFFTLDSMIKAIKLEKI